MAISLNDYMMKYYRTHVHDRDGVALGLDPDAGTWNKFGYNNDIGSAGPEIIASFGGTFQRMTSADTLNLVSTSANDTNGGTGAHGVVIYGINQDREEVIEIVFLSGTTPVTTSAQYYGVNRMALFRTGSLDINDGTISATATTAGSTQAQMPAGEGVTQQCILHIPTGYTFLGTNLRCRVNKLSGGSAPRVTLRGWVYSTVNQSNQLVFKESLDTSTDTIIDVTPNEPFPVTESTILYWELETNTNATVAELRFGGRLVKNNS